MDRALIGVKLQTLLAGKNLYLTSTRKSKALFLKVDVPADADDETRNKVLNVRNVEEYRTEIGKFDPLEFITLLESNIYFFL